MATQIAERIAGSVHAPTPKRPRVPKGGDPYAAMIEHHRLVWEWLQEGKRLGFLESDESLDLYCGPLLDIENEIIAAPATTPLAAYAKLVCLFYDEPHMTGKELPEYNHEKAIRSAAETLSAFLGLPGFSAYQLIKKVGG